MFLCIISKHKITQHLVLDKHRHIDIKNYYFKTVLKNKNERKVKEIKDKKDEKSPHNSSKLSGTWMNSFIS